MKLIATRAGFYGGSRIRVGEAFYFDENAEVQARDPKTGKLQVTADGKPVMVKVRMPKWAAPEPEARKAIAAAKAKERAAAGDTKSAAAAKAAAARARGDGADSLA